MPWEFSGSDRGFTMFSEKSTVALTPKDHSHEITLNEFESKISNSSSSITIYAGLRGVLLVVVGTLKRVWQSSALRSAIV
jgi:hypothetical protein